MSILMSDTELMRASRFLQTHFCTNLGISFTLGGKPMPPMSVFDPDFLLGASAYLADEKMGLSSDRIVSGISSDEDKVFGLAFEFRPFNAFELAQLTSILESFFGVESEGIREDGQEVALDEMIGTLQEMFANEKLKTK